MRVSRRNYPLIFGSVLSLLMIVLALFGPMFAPRDPMQEAGMVWVDGALYGPPPMGQVLGPFRSAMYPLGMDDISRDVLSRLLWAVRPTLLLCSLVVVVRIVVGLLLGLLAGWFGGRIARAVDGLISVSVALPLLAFAVAALLALGLQRSLITFVLALSLTGWIDTAALVKQRTQAVRHAAYIESARAIGRRPAGLLWWHVLPQLRPILSVMVAFEMSAVLLLVAELGYLGFYIGGGYVYTYRVNDFGPDQHLLRTGYPELGQMLSDFFGQLYHTPWVSLFAGCLVFVALIAFALLGEGLRRELDVTRPRPHWRTLLQRVTAPASQPTTHTQPTGSGTEA